MSYMNCFIENYKIIKGDKSTNLVTKATGIPQQTLSNYENGLSEIKLTNLWKRPDFFGCSIDELVGRDN